MHAGGDSDASTSAGNGAAGEPSGISATRCDTAAAENCACKPLATGVTGSLPYEGWVRKLVADPIRCRLYGLSGGTPSEVVVIDTEAKAELTRIELPGVGTDIDMSPNGEWLVVSQGGEHQLSLVDADRDAIKATLPVVSDPEVVEVDDNGIAYYAERNQWVAVRRVDLQVGMPSDTKLDVGLVSAPDLELSSDGAFLYAGESGSSGSFLYKFDVSGGDSTLVAKGTWTDGHGFVYASRSLLVSGSVERVYYGWRELLGDDLKLVSGFTGQSVFAENQTGAFGVGENTLFDTVTLRTLGKLPRTATAAALTSHDKIVWYYDGAMGDGHYANVADLIGTPALGVREIAPMPLNTYTLSKLIADPKRRRLYSIDTKQGLALSIDSDTLEPVASVIVGTSPSDLALNFRGDTLFVGHSGSLGIARIRTSDFSFERFVTVPRVPYEIEPLSDARLATIDQDQWTTPSIVDENTGAVLASSPRAAYRGVLSATADGKTLFVGDTNASRSNMTRYDVSGSALTQVDKTTYDNGFGFENVTHWGICVPDGSGVFYASYLLDGLDLGVLRYQVASPVRAVTPDGKLATTSSAVFDATTGKAIADLGITGDVQAVDAAGEILYLSSPGVLTKVDLAKFR